MTTMHYTYIHRCKDDIARIFYVGKGSKNRYQSHSYRNKHWRGIVAKHGLVAEKIAMWPTHQEALEHEKFLIACFKGMGIQLCNMTEGGDGVVGYVPTEEQRKKTSERMKTYQMSEATKKKISISKIGNKARLGRKNSESHKEKVAAIWKGKTLSEEHKQKLSIAKLGKKLSEETRAKMSAAQLKRYQQ